MKRASAILVVSMVVLGLLASGISCTKTTESEIVANFLNTNPVYSLLSEEKSIFEEYSYVESTKYQEFVKYKAQIDELGKRAIRNREELNKVIPPHALAEFWNMLAKAEPDCRYPNSCGVLDMLICAETSGAPSQMCDWMWQNAIKKNVEAWIKLSAVCREHGIDMPWSFPVVY